MRSVAVLFISLFLTLAAAEVALAQQWGPGSGMYRGAPYGHFCPGRRWGPYGVRNPVRTVDEAAQVIGLYLSGNTEGLRTGRIEERGSYFIAEILDRDGKIVDTVIVAKRTGRIRSIY